MRSMTRSVNHPVTIRPVTALLVTVFLAVAALPVTAEHWPHWRGPNFDGTTDETGLPTTWNGAEGESENIRWKVELPGPAGSTPAVWGDRLFVTSGDTNGDGLWVLALDRSGKELWRSSVSSGSLKIMEQFAHETNAAAPSPVTDGERLYALFGTGELSAFDFDGKVLWRADLTKRYGKPNMYFGLSTSPLVLGDRLYLHLLHTDAQLVLALDTKTGAEVWRHERATDATDECLHSYASVMPFGKGKDASLLVHGADYISAHDLKDGSEQWRYGTLNPKESYNPMFRLVASPVAVDGLVVVPTAKRGPVFGLRPGTVKTEAGTAMEANLTWKLDRGTPDVPSPLIADGLVYLAGENGRLTVLDAETGETLYAERVHQSQHRGSPILADGKLFLTATDGTVSVVRPGRTYELLAKNSVGGGRLAASPAISDGTIYLRTYEALYAVGKVEPKQSGKPAEGR